MEIKEVLEKIREREKEDMVVFLTIDGFMEAKLENFIKQPADGILYDLNRERITTITLAEAGEIDQRWANDYAVAVTIEYLHDRLSASLSEVEKLQNALTDIMAAESPRDMYDIAETISNQSEIEE
jgi:hypothetical protein